MFSFAGIISMFEEAMAIEPTIEQAATTAVADAKSLLANPAVQQLESAFASMFHMTTTPGAAAVVEPKAKTAP